MNRASPHGADGPRGEKRKVSYGRFAPYARFANYTACLALFAGAVLASPLRSDAEIRAGGIYVTTLPNGADTFVDGTYVGRSPVLIGGLGSGHHALTLTKTGWIVADVDVTVSAPAIAMSSTRLLRREHGDGPDAPGSLVLRGVPAGATFSLDGDALVPSDGSVAVPAGIHHLAMTTPHGRTTRQIDVLPETTMQIVLQEARSDEPHPSVVAPAEDYLPTDAFSLTGRKVVVRYADHVVVGHLGEATVRIDGSPMTYPAAPDFIGGRLYLPLSLLEMLTGDTSK